MCLFVIVWPYYFKVHGSGNYKKFIFIMLCHTLICKKMEILAVKNIDDFIELLMVYVKVFEMKNFKLPDTNYLKNLLAQDYFIAVVAKENNKIVGGLTIYVLQQYYSTQPLAYIYDLAVLTEYQRKGIGKKIMNFVTDYCRDKGFEEVYVQADKVDAHAIDFYRKTNPTAEEAVVQFSYHL